MDFADLKTRVGRGVLRDDLAASYGCYINEALREIQNRRSWTWMKVTATVTLPASDGESSVPLATNFKEFQKRTALFFVTDDGGLVPAETVFESQQIYRVWVFWGTPIVTWPPRVFFERQGGNAVIGMVEPRTSDFNFRADYYGYLPDLVNDGDTNELLTRYPQMVLAKAKAIAFADINDADAIATNNALYETELSKAIGQDAYSEVRGRDTRM